MASKSHLLGSLILRPVLEQHLEQCEGSILVQGLGEAIKRRWNLQTLIQDTPLSLDPHVLGPLNESVHILFWRRSTTHSCSRQVCFTTQDLLTTAILHLW